MLYVAKPAGTLKITNISLLRGAGYKYLCRVQVLRDPQPSTSLDNITSVYCKKPISIYRESTLLSCT